MDNISCTNCKCAPPVQDRIKIVDIITELLIEQEIAVNQKGDVSGQVLALESFTLKEALIKVSCK